MQEGRGGMGKIGAANPGGPWTPVICQPRATVL
jgi:hypothetical protein